MSEKPEQMQRRNQIESVEDNPVQTKKEEKKSQSSKQIIPGERKIIRIKRKWAGEENKENIVQNQQIVEKDESKIAEEQQKTKIAQETSETQFTEDSSQMPRGLFKLNTKLPISSKLKPPTRFKFDFTVKNDEIAEKPESVEKESIKKSSAMTRSRKKMISKQNTKDLPTVKRNSKITNIPQASESQSILTYSQKPEEASSLIQINPLSTDRALKDLRKSRNSIHSKASESNIFGIDLTDSPPNKISFFKSSNDQQKDKINSFLSSASSQNSETVEQPKPKFTRNLFQFHKDDQTKQEPPKNKKKDPKQIEMPKMNLQLKPQGVKFDFNINVKEVKKEEEVKEENEQKSPNSQSMPKKPLFDFSMLSAKPSKTNDELEIAEEDEQPQSEKKELAQSNPQVEKLFQNYIAEVKHMKIQKDMVREDGLISIERKKSDGSDNNNIINFVHRSFTGRNLYDAFIIPKISKIKDLALKTDSQASCSTNAEKSDELCAKISIFQVGNQDPTSDEKQPKFEQEHLIIKFLERSVKTQFVQIVEQIINGEEPNGA